MERCESGRIGRFRKPLSRKAPGVRIPLSPMGIKEKSFGGDSKRGPADLWEEKGTEGGPVGANPPLSGKKEREYSCGGFETRSQPPMGGERDRGRPRRGALVRAIPLSPIRRRGNIAVGESKRGPNHLGRKKGPKAAPEGCPSKGYPPLSDKKERGLFIVFILYLTCKSIDLEW